MKISKTSWHYWLNNKLRDDSHTMYNLKRGYPVSLCWYFWFTIVTIIQALAGAIMLATFGTGLVYLSWVSVINPVVSMFALFTGYGYELAYIEGLYIGIVLLCVITTWGGCYFYSQGEIKFAPEWLSKHFKRQRKVAPVAHKEPSIFFKYIKAKKQKVCPLIELDEK